jgi:chromosomal replication initiation ATPase DnaA
VELRRDPLDVEAGQFEISGYLDAGSPRLSEILFSRRPHSFATLAALPSNVEAIEAGLLFSTGLATFVGVVGPSGWGKSHLLEAVVHRLERDRVEGVRRLDVQKYLQSPSKFEQSRILVLDDVQEVLSKGKQRQSLRFHMERRVRSRRPTLLAFTANTANRHIRNLLPQLREWTIVTMQPPTAPERVPLLAQLCSAEGLSLSPQLTHVIATQMHGNGRTLCGALKRLRMAGSSWMDAVATLRACALLDPFFSDNGDWDLPRRILKIADENRNCYHRVSVADMALFTMMHEARIGELEVARAAQVEPAEAYARAMRFKRTHEIDLEAQGAVRHFIELIVSQLTR